MIRTPQERMTCNRCGLCCEDVQLPVGPEKMKAILSDPKESEHNKQVASMLVWFNQYHLDLPQSSRNVHHYTCINYSRDEEGKGVCGIHDTRPDMCSKYPHYFGMQGHPTAITPEEKIEVISKWPYPAQYTGCSYNIDDRIPSVIQWNVKDFKPE